MTVEESRRNQPPPSLRPRPKKPSPSPLTLSLPKVLVRDREAAALLASALDDVTANPRPLSAVTRHLAGAARLLGTGRLLAPITNERWSGRPGFASGRRWPSHAWT